MPGNAVYGTATADTVISTNSDLNYGADGQVFFNEDELHPVNRRRGIVYVAGSNFADSVYARYVHFGQYFDPNTMVFDQDTNVIQNFYLLYNKDVDGPANETDNPGLVRISNPDDPEAIKLGQLVAGSYVVNRRVLIRVFLNVILMIAPQQMVIIIFGWQPTPI